MIEVTLSWKHIRAQPSAGCTIGMKLESVLWGAGVPAALGTGPRGRAHVLCPYESFQDDLNLIFFHSNILQSLVSQRSKLKMVSLTDLIKVGLSLYESVCTLPTLGLWFCRARVSTR